MDLGMADSSSHQSELSMAEQVVLITIDDNHRQTHHDDDQKSNHSPPPAMPNSNINEKTLRRVSFSKPKSRFSEPISTTNATSTYPLPELSSEDSDSDSDSDSDFDDDDSSKRHRSGKSKTKGKIIPFKFKVTRRAWIEFAFFLLVTTFLICSLTLNSLKNEFKFGIEIWKWCLMVLVLFSGRLVAGWAVGFLVFLIERNFILKEKVVYFVYGLRRSFQNCVWLALALVSWTIMFHGGGSRNAALIKKLFRGLVAVLIGATLWLVKILLVKVLASSFHVTTYFDRMKESVFHHYILEALSGPPLEVPVDGGSERRGLWRRRGWSSRQTKSMPTESKRKPRAAPMARSMTFSGGGGGGRRIDMERLRKLSMESRASAWSVKRLKKLSMESRGSAWSVKRLVKYIKSSGLSTISTAVDGFRQSEIQSEVEARSCAHRIFRHVAKPAAKYIEEEDLLRFLTTDEVQTIFSFFEGAIETGKITKSSFRNWLVHAYVERKALAYSLNDTKTAVNQLHKLASAIAIVIMVVISLLVMGLATIKVLLVVTSQLLLVGFMFQNTCKTIFESIIFVFVMHPFDVGDRCVIDDIQMIVEEMNILTTVFLRYDMEKIYYPNSVLISKPISNFRRSPDMGDSVEFTIDVSTSIDDFNALKKAIQTYIESKPKYWNPKHSVLVKEIENVDKMKLLLCVQHTMNHQNYGEKSSRRSELVFELKRIFDNLGIKYHLLPQLVQIAQLNYTTSNARFSI
ncbi:Mechanosensitive ion channel protein 10 [Linum perenne]